VGNNYLKIRICGGVHDEHRAPIALIAPKKPESDLKKPPPLGNNKSTLSWMGQQGAAGENFARCDFSNTNSGMEVTCFGWELFEWREKGAGNCLHPPYI